MQRALLRLLRMLPASLLLLSVGFSHGTVAALRPGPSGELPGPGPGPEARLALEMINRYRAAAGLPPVTYDPALGAAAQAHAEYLAANPDQWEPSAHGETPGSPGFTGLRPVDRAAANGYRGGVGEIIHFAGPAEAAVDGWLQTLYHRLPLLSPNTVALGYGVAASADGRYVNVLDYGVVPLSGGRDGGTAPSSPGPSSATAAPGSVAWPHPGQTGVPTHWDGREVPDPFLLHPGVTGPVGYPITLTFPGPVRSLRLTEASLHGPDGAVSVLRFDPVSDDRLTDTVALIPAEPLRPRSRYTVRMQGLVDRGGGPQPFSRSWSFSTGTDSHAPRVRSLTTWMDGIRLEGQGFGSGMAVYAGGLPVQGLQVADDGSATFRLPDRCPGDGTELLVVSPGGSETAVPLAAGCNLRTGADSPYRTVPLQIAGRSLDVPALLAPNGAVLVPEDALAALGAQPEPAGQPASMPGRTYWRLGDRFGAYTPGRVTAWVAGERVRLSLPVQPYDGVVYVDKAFVQRLAGVEIRLVNGVAHVGGH